jgi:hypothetical protein
MTPQEIQDRNKQIALKRIMKGIYLTQQTKEEIETKIKELERLFLLTENDTYVGSSNALIEILSSAIILPVEEGWHKTYGKNNLIEYPQGVLIQPKKSNEKDNL